MRLNAKSRYALKREVAMRSTIRQHPPKKQPGQGRGPRRINGAALDVLAASDYYGGTVKQTRGLVDRRLISFKRLGGRIIFLREELEQWLATMDGCSLAEAKSNVEMRHGKPGFRAVTAEAVEE